MSALQAFCSKCERRFVWEGDGWLPCACGQSTPEDCWAERRKVTWTGIPAVEVRSVGGADPSEVVEIEPGDAILPCCLGRGGQHRPSCPQRPTYRRVKP